MNKQFVELESGSHSALLCTAIPWDAMLVAIVILLVLISNSVMGSHDSESKRPACRSGQHEASIRLRQCCSLRRQ